MNIKCSLMLLFSFVLSSCASKTASYYYAQKQLQNNDVSFNRTLRVDEYLNAFPQDWLIVPNKSEIILRIDPLTQKIPATGENSIFQLAVKTRKLTQEEAREPMAISFVVDVSGSMAGEKINDTKAALQNSIQELKEGDIVSFVTFNNESKVVASAVTITANSRQELLSHVKSINADGGTNIESGLVSGYREMAKFPEDISKRLLMLTDGQSTVDALTPDQIASKAAVQYIEGARISTIGLGYDVDESLLRKIAHEGQGNYYFADTSKTLTKILREDLQTTIVPIAKDVKLKVTLGDTYDLVNIHGVDFSNPPSSTEIDLNLGELNANDWRIVILEVKRVADNDTVISATGSYYSLSKQSQITLSQTTDSVSSEETLNKYVLRNSVLYANARSLIEASRLYEEKNSAAALHILDLQLNNNEVLASIDDSEMLQNERKTLQKTRDIIAASSLEARSAVGKNDHQDNQGGMTKNIVVAGLKLVADVLPGLWSTLANVLVLAVE